MKQTAQDLEVFSELRARITLFVEPTKKITVSSFATSQEAIEAGKTIKTILNEVESRRTEKVKPLNDQVKAINAYVKDITAPLLAAETHIKAQLARFADEQEKLRLAELRRIEEEKREAERKAAEERARIEAELQAKKEAELKALEADKALIDEDDIFGVSDGPTAEDIEAERARIEEDAALERARIQAQLEQEAAVRRGEQLRAEQEASDAHRIKNTRKTWKCEAVDLDKVPREFLVITLNTQAVLAAARAGVKEIPGVRIWQETAIGFGQNTYVPELALEAEADRNRGRR